MAEQPVETGPAEHRGLTAPERLLRAKLDRLPDSDAITVEKAVVEAMLRAAEEERGVAQTLAFEAGSLRDEVERLRAQRDAVLAVAAELDGAADDPRPDADYDEREAMWSVAARIREVLGVTD